MMKRNGKAQWLGAIKDGKGTLTTPSGVLKDTQYSFASRFENGIGTNPEELLGAAHAGCFSMALSGQLGAAQLTPKKIETTATVELNQEGAGFTITRVHLAVTAEIPGASNEAFQKAAQEAKAGCPVSKLFKGAEITMEAKLLTTA
jgi:osmotically inducible protein OsmC